MNNKGQALVEFVLILPIFIFLILIIIDFGIVFNKKNELENVSLDVINLYNSGNLLTDIENIYSEYEIVVGDQVDYYEITISREVDLITPGLKKILGDPYIIDVVRNVPYA